MAPPSLALHAAAARAEALQKERARLLRDVGKKKQQLAQARAKAERDEQAAWSGLAPLIARFRVATGEVSELFEQLLGEERLSTRAGKELSKLRRSLELSGLLLRRAEHDDDDGEQPELDGAADDDSEPARRPARGQARPATSSATPEVASARQPDSSRRSLREIFRSLARAVHPDQARQELEREQRTEVMKEVTRAYENGDLARLLELESAWQSQRAQNPSDAEVRCVELESVNRELLKQVRQLTRELRDVKQDARDVDVGPLDLVIAQAGRELEYLALLVEFLRKFRDDKASLGELSWLPKLSRGSTAARDRAPWRR